MGKARYLLNIVFLHLDVRIISFPYKSLFFLSPFSPLYSALRDKVSKEYSLIGKTGNSKLQIISSSLNALGLLSAGFLT